MERGHKLSRSKCSRSPQQVVASSDQNQTQVVQSCFNIVLVRDFAWVSLEGNTFLLCEVLEKPSVKLVSFWMGLVALAC